MFILHHQYANKYIFSMHEISCIFSFKYSGNTSRRSKILQPVPALCNLSITISACNRSLSFFLALLTSPLIVILLLYRLIHSSLATDDVGVQDESVFESTATDRAYFARHDAALKSLMSAQGCRGLVRFSASAALVLGIARALLSDTSGYLVW